jgi:hypothetical protein
MTRLVDGADAERETPTAVVVNETFARRFFPGGSLRGRHFSGLDGDQKLVDQEIVGLARDAKYGSLREPAPPTAYVPHHDDRGVTIEVRTRRAYRSDGRPALRIGHGFTHVLTAALSLVVLAFLDGAAA